MSNGGSLRLGHGRLTLDRPVASFSTAARVYAPHTGFSLVVVELVRAQRRELGTAGAAANVAGAA